MGEQLDILLLTQGIVSTFSPAAEIHSKSSFRCCSSGGGGVEKYGRLVRRIQVIFVSIAFVSVTYCRDGTKQDTVVLLSSGKVPLADGDLEDFEEKLEAVCAGLAEDVVRNGEGTGHVMEVCGNESSQFAARCRSCGAPGETRRSL